jgi:hypothetical protein
MALTGSARVLVVDNDPAILAAAGRGLRLEGFDVTTAGGGSAALALLRAGTFDAVVLDVVMPDVDGVTSYGDSGAPVATFRSVSSLRWERSTVALSLLFATILADWDGRGHAGRRD